MARFVDGGALSAAAGDTDLLEAVLSSPEMEAAFLDYQAVSSTTTVIETALAYRSIQYYSFYERYFFPNSTRRERIDRHLSLMAGQYRDEDYILHASLKGAKGLTVFKGETMGLGETCVYTSAFFGEPVEDEQQVHK